MTRHDRPVFCTRFSAWPSAPRGSIARVALTKRAVVFAEWLHTTVLWPVAHRQIVLTIPKMLRVYFRYDRRLLGELCRVAAEVLVTSFRVLLGMPLAEPGLVVCVHSFGNLLNFHPHLHVMATDGGFTPELEKEAV